MAIEIDRCRSGVFDLYQALSQDPKKTSFFAFVGNFVGNFFRNGLGIDKVYDKVHDPSRGAKVLAQALYQWVNG